MSNKIFSLLIFLTIFSCKNNSTENIQGIADYAITNVTLIDGSGADAVPNATISIKDEKISRITRDPVGINADSIIDGTGKYVIPGLFDNHFHLSDDIPRQFKHLIHFGVTNVFIPAGRYMTYPVVRKYDSLIRTNTISGPTLRWSSPFITVPGGHPRGNGGIEGENIHRITSTAEIPKIVEDAKANGAIALKVMIEDGPRPPFIERIKPELIKRLRQEANRHNLMLVTHISDRIELEMSVEHKADAIMHYVNPSLDWESDLELVQKIKDQNIYWVTTAMLGKAYTTYPLNPELLESEHWAVFDKEKEILKKEAGQHKEIALGIVKNYYNLTLEQWKDHKMPSHADFRKLDSLGITIVVGTDKGSPNLYNASGLGVHEEMQIYQDGDMDPLNIIKCATLNAAKMLKMDKDYGTIEEGKYANMVLLDKNPLENISNTLTINTVFKYGEIQNRITNANNGNRYTGH